MKLHIVRPGDTLRKIARRFDIPVQRLMELNPSLDPERPEPGAKVKIPGGKVPVARQRKGKAAVAGEKPKPPHRKPESPPSSGNPETSQEGTESPEEQPLPKRPDQSPSRMMPPMPKAPEYRPGMAEERVPEQVEMPPYFTAQPLPYPFPSMSFPYTGQPSSQPITPYSYAYPMWLQPEQEDRQGWPVPPDPGTGQPHPGQPLGGEQPGYRQQPQQPGFPYPGYGQPGQEQPQQPGFPYPGYGQPGQEQVMGFPAPGYGEQPEQGETQQPWIPMPYPIPGYPQSQGFNPIPGASAGESASEEDGDADSPSVDEPKANDWDVSTLLHEEETAWEESSTEK